MKKSITTKQWTLAFVIGIIGSVIFKGLELIGQKILTGEWIWQRWDGLLFTGDIIIIQLLFLIILSSTLVFVIMKLFRRLWVISFVPFLYYLIKEFYNMITSYQHFVLTATLESLIGIPIGFGVYYLVNKLK